MIRPAIVIVLLMTLTGCLATLTPNQTKSSTFGTGLKNLEQSGDKSVLKELAENREDPIWSEYSRSILKIHADQEKKVKSLQKKNKSLTAENKKLRSDLNKLNQINLELEKRVN